jgi:hypothetical protein
VSTLATRPGIVSDANQQAREPYQPIFPLVFLVGDSDCTWNPVELAQAANDGNPYAQAALNPHHRSTGR